MACIHGASAGEREEREQLDMVEMAISKYLIGCQERQRLHGETRNGAWLSAIPHHLNGTELSRKEL